MCVCVRVRLLVGERLLTVLHSSLLRECGHVDERLVSKGFHFQQVIQRLSMRRVGQNHIYVCKYGACTVFLAGKLPYIRPYTVCIYGSGQP